MSFNWDRAIELNQTALTRIVAALIAMVGLAGGDMPDRISRPVYRAVLLVLRPAESAVRRLIVIAARSLVAKPTPYRPMPAGLKISRSGSARVSFPLVDQPKHYHFGPRRRKGPQIEPRIHFFHVVPLVPMFMAEPQPNTEPVDDGMVAAACLGRRLQAVRMALDTLPRQAMRLARWRARQAITPTAVIRSPLRFGRPPGHRDRHRHEVDAVLKECDWLARDVLRQNTS